ncbi:MAG: ABC transporter permease [Candidatus Acidiferrum sp.]
MSSTRNIGIVYRKELRESLRDRRTLISSVLVPLLLFPVLMGGGTVAAVKLLDKAKQENAKVMILGGEESATLVAELKKLEGIEVVEATANWKNQIINKELRAAVEIPGGFEQDLARQKSGVVTIYTYQQDLKSALGAEKVEKYVKEYRDRVVSDRLAAKNLPSSVLVPFEIKQQGVAPPEKAGGAVFGGMMSYMVILMCLTGAMYPAMDLTAGEKERGTMETILSSPISRMHLVMGKFLLVTTASLLSAVLSVTSMGVSFWVLQKINAFGVARNGNSTAIPLKIGAGAMLSVLIMAIPIAVFFSAVLFTIALFAKTQKEAQTYLTPITFLVIVPAIAAILPGVELTPKLALVPVLNVSLLCKDLTSGTYHWGYMAMIFASSCVYAAAALFVAVKMFQRESVLFRS